MKKMLLFAALAVGAQWAWAQSTIVYSPGPGFALPWEFGPPATLDLNQDGTIDFSFSLGPTICTMDVPTSLCSQPAFVGVAGTNAVLTHAGYVASVPFGEWIGSVAWSNTAWFSGSYSYLFIFWYSPSAGNSGMRGPIGEQGGGYIGVRFSAEDGDHYGWVYLHGWNVVDWAYEMRPNQPIRAGAKPVPVHISQVSVEGAGYLRLVAATETGKAYQVQIKQSLLDFSWSNLSFALPASSTNTAVDIPMTGQKSFFRVVEAE